MRLLTLITLFLAATAAVHAQSTTLATDTISMKMLEISSTNAQRAVAAGSESYTYNVIIGGTTYPFTSLTMKGYADDFKRTGGRLLSTGGLDFRFLQNYSHPVFLIFNGFLVLMLGFYWISKVNEVSKGKGGLDIIPLLGKLCVGLIVVYNMPFVYAVAMTLKDLGLRIVTYAINDQGTAGQPSAAAQNLSAASLNPLTKNVAKDTAVKGGVLDAIQNPINIPPIIPIGPTTAANGTPTVPDQRTMDRNSGRLRLSVLVADLNRIIGEYQTNVKPVNVKTAANGDRTVVESQGFDDIAKKQLIDFVGFSPEKNSLSLDPAGDLSLSRSEVSSSDRILATVAADVYTANQLRRLYFLRLMDYMRLQGVSYSDDNQILAAAALSPNTTFFRVTSLPVLGPDLISIETEANKKGGDSTGSQNYREQIQMASARYVNKNIFTPSIVVPTTTPDQFGGSPNAIAAADQPGWFKRQLNSVVAFGGDVLDSTVGVIGKILDWLNNLPTKIAELVLSVVKWAWVPIMSHLANFVFNITIEAYVYILWLAFPFWFYEKTKKAFTGALDTLVAVSFTAAVFSLLCLIFESFAGAILRSLTVTSSSIGLGSGAVGAAAGAGAAAAVLGATSPIWGVAAPLLLGMLAALAIGFAIFYMVGTFLCFRLAPQIFKAFKEGSSVITPMLQAAATAVVSGAAAGVLAGVGGAGLAAGAAKLAGSSQALAGAKALGGAVKDRAAGLVKKNTSKAGDYLKSTKAGQAVSSALKRGGAIARRAGQAVDSAAGLSSKAQAVRGVASKVSDGVQSATQWTKDAAKKVAGQDVIAGAQLTSDGFKTDKTKFKEAAKGSVSNFLQDPVSGLARMGQSKAAQIVLLGASGFSGDPGAPLKNLGTALVATQLLQNTSQNNQKSTAPGSGPADTKGIEQAVRDGFRGSSGQEGSQGNRAGGSSGSGGSSSKTKPDSEVENKPDTEKSGSSSSSNRSGFKSKP